jgi:hypothetical protein
MIEAFDDLTLRRLFLVDEISLSRVLAELGCRLKNRLVELSKRLVGVWPNCFHIHDLIVIDFRIVGNTDKGPWCRLSKFRLIFLVLR